MHVRLAFVKANALSSSRMTTLSALATARLHQPGVPDRVLVVDLAQQIVAELGLRPPVNLELLASFQGVHRVEVSDLPWSGCIICQGGVVTIRLRASDSAPRRRFTCCHEIGHTLLPGFAHTTQYRCTPGSPGKDGTDSALEQLCDLAAAELLLPRAHALVDLVAAPFGLSTVEQVANDYEASLDATARRLVSLTSEPILMLDLRLAASKSETQPRLRVHSTSRTGSWPFIPHNKSVAAGHLLQQALAGTAVDTAADLSCLVAGAAPLPVDLSARLYPYYDHEGTYVQRVLALARPVSPPTSGRRRR